MLRGRVLTCLLTAACAVGVVGGVMAPPAGAASLTVNTTVDETNSGDGACSLREAILAVDQPGNASGDCAPAAFGANTIVLGANTYSLSSSNNELRVEPTVTNLTIKGVSESKTTIDARLLGDRALEVSAGATVTLQNLTITNAQAHAGTNGAQGGGSGTAGANGGGILNEGSLTLTDAAVTASNAGFGGTGGTGGSGGTTGGTGGIGGQGGSGGGIYNTGTLSLIGATIAGDHGGTGGPGGSGGAGTTTGGSGGTGGASGDGGGISNAGGTLTIADSTIRGNGSGGAGPGGNGGTGPTGGTGGAGGAAASGGGLSVPSGSLTVTNSTFASNTGGFGGTGGSGGFGTASGGDGGLGGSGGGGGAVLASGGSLQSVTIAGNSAGPGGAGGNGGSGGTAGNPGTAGAAGASGGVAGQGSAIGVQNSLLASNSGGNCSGSISDLGTNLTFGPGGCPPTFLTGDPDLGPLQDNGGPSQTISLAAASAALNKVPPKGAGCQPTDQRGVPRPSGAACDIGAFEAAPPKVTTGPASGIGSGGATLTGATTPNAGTASVQFIFGRTTKYGSKTTVQHLGGVTSTPVSAKLAKLKAKTTYHYRLVVVTQDGVFTGADRTFKTVPPPTLSRFKITPSSFRAGGKGATITYSDTQASSVKFVVLGSKGNGFVSVGSFKRSARRGANRLSFSGRVGGRKLARGTYRLQATPTAGKITGKPVTLTFKITG